MKKIDCHRHCSYTDKDFCELIESAKKFSIEKILMFGHNMGLEEKSFDQKIWQWHLKFPDLIMPLACDFNYNKSDITYAEQCLKQGFLGFGELLIGHSGARNKGLSSVNFGDEVPIALFNMAGKYSSFVLVHCNSEFSESFLRAVKRCEKTIFIWAHIGYDFKQGLHGDLRSAREIEKFIYEYPNLLFDISFWKKDALCMNTPKYIDLLERHNTRFLWGLDLTDNYMQKQEEWYESYNVVLSQLSDSSRCNILYQNAENLLQKRFCYILKDI